MEFQEVNVNLEMVVIDEPSKASLQTWATAVTVGKLEGLCGRSRGGVRDARTLSPFLIFLCSFRQNLCQIIG